MENREINDKMRLDWLQKHKFSPTWSYGGSSVWLNSRYRGEPFSGKSFRNIRQAIDAEIVRMRGK